MINDYRFEKLRENTTTTISYDLVGDFPVRFIDLFEWILDHDKFSSRIQFIVINNGHDGWNKSVIEVCKSKNTSYWSLVQQAPENCIDDVFNKNIARCSAIGSCGQMTYFLYV